MTSKDLISRQQAIDALDKHIDTFDAIDTNYLCGLRTAMSILKEMPSAQPDIIRCGDCKWYGRADKRRFYRGMDCLQKRIDTIVPDRDFCSKAERRTDEE